MRIKAKNMPKDAFKGAASVANLIIGLFVNTLCVNIFPGNGVCKCFSMSLLVILLCVQVAGHSFANKVYGNTCEHSERCSREPSSSPHFMEHCILHVGFCFILKGAKQYQQTFLILVVPYSEQVQPRKDLYVSVH